MISDWKHDELRMVLAHELAHIKRKDVLWMLILAITQAVYFFNPLVWIFTKQWHLSQEMACDAAVIEISESSTIMYAEILLKVALQPKKQRYGLAALGAAESYSLLKSRLLGLGHHGRIRPLLMVVILLMIAVLCTATLIRWDIAEPVGLVDSWGSSGDGPEQMRAPIDIAVGPDGSVYLPDAYASNIKRFRSDGGFIKQWGSKGKRPGQFDSATGIAVDKKSGNVYVSDEFNGRVQIFSPAGNFIKQIAPKIGKPDTLGCPFGIAVAPDCSMYVAASANYAVRKFDKNGRFITTWGTPGKGDGQFAAVDDLAVDKDGNVYVVDGWNHRIQKFSPDGKFICKWGSKGQGPGQFMEPCGITIDDQGRVYATDRYTTDKINKQRRVFATDHSPSDRIQVFTANGKYITEWPVHRPNAVTVDGNDLYVVSQWRVNGPNGGVTSRICRAWSRFKSKDASEPGWHLRVYRYDLSKLMEGKQ
jgi:DNA-binding beta-propeller fold protein YncE